MSARPLRLLHLIDVRNVGGVERIFADFIAQPAPFPVRHLTVADHSKIAPLLKETVLQNSQFTSMRHFAGLPLPRRPRFLRQKNRLRLVRALQPDLVIVWNQIIDFYDLKPSQRAFPCPVLYYEHGAAWYRYHEARVRGFFAQVDAAVAVSQAAKRMLQLKHQVTLPIDVHLNALRPGVVPPPMAARTLPVLSEARPLRFGCAGRLVPVKCMGLVVLTVQALRARGIPAEAVIVGEGSERPVLEALIVQCGLQQHVKLMGLCRDMEAFYRGIDFYLGTSMHESFGLTCLEASAWGVPVITSAMDGMPEAVRDGETGLCLLPTLDREAYLAMTKASPEITESVYWPANDEVAPPKMLDPDRIADAVIGVMGDPAYYQRLSAQAMAYVQSQGGFEALCASLYRTIEALRPGAIVDAVLSGE